MTKKIAVKEMETIRGMLLANSIQNETMAQLLIEKGLITNEEYLLKLKKVQAEYQRRIKTAG